MSTELADGVWWLDLGNVNAYLVDDGGTLTLVDAGTPWDAADVAAGIADAGLDVSDVERVLVTHYDLDHVGSLAKLADLDASVYVGAADAGFVTGDRRPNWRNRKGLFQLVSSVFVSAPDLPIRTVADGDEVGSFTAYHTPGHSPGHTAYVSESLGIGLLGDLVRAEDGALEVPPWFINYDTATVEESIRSLAERAPDFAVAAMGHGDPLATGGGEALRRLAASL